MPNPGTGLLADVSLDMSAPFTSRDMSWDVGKAKKALRAWATKPNGDLDEAKYAKAFLWRPAGQPPSNFKLPVATVEGGKLKIVFRALAAAAAALHQGGGRSVALSPGELRQVRSAVEKLYEKASKSFKDDKIRAPWTKAALCASLVARGAALEESLSDVHGWTPPAEHFTPFPADQEPHGLRIGSDGRISGYLASFDGLIGSNCHLGYLADGECFVPPRSPDGAFPHFHQNNTPVRLDDGSDVMPGILVTDIGHGDPAEDDQDERINHYEDPNAIIGPVVAGQDDRGIYLAGTALPELLEDTPEAKARLRKLNLARYSGHWEDIDGVMELIGAVVVNWPGFSNPNATGSKVSAAMNQAHQRLAASGLRAATVSGSDRPYRLVAAAAIELGVEAQQMLADVIGVELPEDAAPVLLDAAAAEQIRRTFDPPPVEEEVVEETAVAAADGPGAKLTEQAPSLTDDQLAHVQAIADALGFDARKLAEALQALASPPVDDEDLDPFGAAAATPVDSEDEPLGGDPDPVGLDAETVAHIDALAESLDLDADELAIIIGELSALPDEDQAAALDPFTRAVSSHLTTTGMDPLKSRAASVILVRQLTKADGIPGPIRAKAFVASIAWDSRARAAR